MNVVPMQTTPISQLQAVNGLLAVMPELSRESASLLLALIWIETGAGKSLQNNNVGNISAGSSYTGSAWRPPWFPEPAPDASARTRHLHEEMLAGRAPSAFRAYPSLVEGFQDYKAQLLRSFPEVIRAAETGDAHTFTTALGQKYSKDYANNEPAAVNIGKLQNSFLPLLGGLVSRPLPRGPVSTIPAPLPSSLPPPLGLPRSSSGGLSGVLATLPTLRVGSHGVAVELFFGTTEVYSANLVDVVSRWQKARGLKGDGIVGPVTWNAFVKEFWRMS